MKKLITNKDISIIRDYSAGSNATTILCMDEKSTFYRKYAFGKDGDKLSKQIEWIEANKDILPLPEIIRKEIVNGHCYYDMQYCGHTVGFFEYVHSMPITNSWKMIEYVIQTLENSIYIKDTYSSDDMAVSKYYCEKVTNNISTIIKGKRICELQVFNELIINGDKYKNLSYYIERLNKELFLQLLKDDIYSCIHGDLTLENIICIRNDQGEDTVYFIDPNTGNIHDSKYLDYAKLMQSLHGEYEFIKSVKDIKVENNTIDFTYTHSSVYKELRSLFEEYIIENYGMNVLKKIYLHEIVHWIRLLPYQIKNNEKNAVAFYAKMIIVIDEIFSKYLI